MTWCGDSKTLHMQAAVSAAADCLRCCAMTPPQETGSRPGTSRHLEFTMVYPHQEPRLHSVQKVFLDGITSGLIGFFETP